MLRDLGFTGCCEDGNKCSSSIKTGNFCSCSAINMEVLKMDCVHRNYDPNLCHIFSDDIFIMLLREDGSSKPIRIVSNHLTIDTVL